MPNCNSKFPDTAGRKATKRRRTQATAKSFTFHASAIICKERINRYGVLTKTLLHNSVELHTSVNAYRIAVRKTEEN